MRVVWVYICFRFEVVTSMNIKLTVLGYDVD